MKEKSPHRPSKAARQAAEKEFKEILPTLESVAAEPADKQLSMKKSAERAHVERMSTYTVDRVTKEIGDLQVSVSRLLTDLSQRLREESGRLAEIHSAIEILPRVSTRYVRTAYHTPTKRFCSDHWNSRKPTL